MLNFSYTRTLQEL